MDTLARAEALARAAVLSDVPPPALVALATRAAVVRLDAGERRSTRRDGSDVIAVVVEGAVREDGEDGGAGALFGELGAFGVAASELVASAASVLLEIAVDDFLDLLAEHPAASAALARRLAATIRGPR